VSKILWHFTGGPTWNRRTGKQNKKPKPAKDAYKSLKAILRQRKLRVGRYRESVTGIADSHSTYRMDPETEELVETHRQENVPVKVESSSVCCLADIPIAHLSYHSKRYGKFAIGFHRSSAVRERFNPVLYTLENSGIPVSFAVKRSGLDDQIESLREIHRALKYKNPFVKQALDLASEFREEIDKFLTLIKSFKPDEFTSVYCEREWRSVQPFRFSFYRDVAMIVLPKEGDREDDRDYFRLFVEYDARKLDLPRSVPIVPWEDLLEN
jgi:hypothetical protein